MREGVRDPRSTQHLVEMSLILGLTRAEGAGVLHVTSAELDDWYERGVPANRVQDVQDIADLANALQCRFVRERIPKIVRAALPGLNHRSILATLADSGSATVLEMLDRAFSYSR